MKHTTKIASLATAITLLTGCAATKNTKNNVTAEDECSKATVLSLEKKINAQGRSSADRILAIADNERQDLFSGTYSRTDGKRGRFSVVMHDNRQEGNLHIKVEGVGEGVKLADIQLGYSLNRSTGKKEITNINDVVIAGTDGKVLFEYVSTNRNYTPEEINAAIKYVTVITDNILRTEQAKARKLYGACQREKKVKMDQIAKALGIDSRTLHETKQNVPAQEAKAPPSMPPEPTQPAQSTIPVSGNPLPEGYASTRRDNFCAIGYARLNPVIGMDRVEMKARNYARKALADHLQKETGNPALTSQMVNGARDTRRWNADGKRYIEMCIPRTTLSPDQRYNQQR